MTQPTDDFDDFESGGAGELFDPRSHQNHLLIVKLWDEISPVVTEFCPTGYVTRNGKEWPNNALRASIVDLDVDADDGTRGRVYSQAMILTGLLIKELKRSVGKTLLLIWKQKDPSDKSSPYSVYEMKHDTNAVDLGRKWLNDHPEFKAISAPPPWTATFREREEYDPRKARPEWQRDDGYRSQRDPGPRYDDRGPRDYGQHDDRRYDRHDGYTDTRRQRDEPPPRRDPYARDPYSGRGRDDRGDGTFLSRSRNAQGGYQNDEPPF